MPTNRSQPLTRLTELTSGGAASLPNVSIIMRSAPNTPVSHCDTIARIAERSVHVELRNILVWVVFPIIMICMACKSLQINSKS